jgi:hypothetical protein
VLPSFALVPPSPICEESIIVVPSGKKEKKNTDE